MGNFWSQPLRVECREYGQLITSRTINSRLWFVNNPELERLVLPYLAKYQEKFGLILYAFVIVGNHYHILAQFPHGRRSEFFRDFNARFAEAVRLSVPEFIGGPLFSGRFRPQVLPLNEDIEKYFFYCGLQPVSSGFAERISDYSGYNSFYTAATQRETKFKLFNYGKYNAAKRSNPNVSRTGFTEEYTLRYEKLPHLRHLSSADYKKVLLERLEAKRVELVQKRLGEGKKFLTKDQLRAVAVGSLPFSTKKGGLIPLVLSCCSQAKNQYLNFYFSIVAAYRAAAARYRSGEFDVTFPRGTFRPHGVCLVPT